MMKFLYSLGHEDGLALKLRDIHERFPNTRLIIQ